jgi:hypothetical protein
MRKILLLVASLAIAGCASDKPASSGETRARSIKLRDAQKMALSLQPGMTREEVTALLGSPTETEAGTHGQLTKEPWQGLDWNYQWGSGLDRKTLRVTFEEGSSSAWVVNSWNWY